MTAVEWSAVGRRIVDVRPTLFDDLGYAVALVLDDGTEIFASMDAEGNGPGELFASLPNGNEVTICVTRVVKENI